MEGSGEGAHVSEPGNDGKDEDRGRETDLSDIARASPPSPPPPRKQGSSFLRGCGIAFGIAFLLFAFVVGACFIQMG